MGTLELNNISASYINNKVIDNFSFKINKGSNISILGGIATGKTTLVNILGGSAKYDGEYIINGVSITKPNTYLIKRFISIVENKKMDNNRKVVDLLFDSLDGKDYDSSKEEKTVKSIIKFFDIDNLLDSRINSLEYNYRFYVMIIAALLKKNDYLVLDDVLCHLNNLEVNKIFTYAKKIKISIINFTSNINETLYGEYLILLYNKKIAMEGETFATLKEERLLKRIGFSLPFMVDLSTQLNYYEIIDDFYLDQEEMLKMIWN